MNERQWKVLTTARPGEPEWHAAHKGKLGSRDVASLLRDADGKRIGRRSPADLWMTLTEKSKPEDISKDPAVMRGIALEPVLLELYARECGETVTPYPGLIENPDLPCVAVSADALVGMDTARPGAVEGKTINPRYRSQWETEGVPDLARVQGETIMWTLGLPRCVFVAYGLDRDEILSIEHDANPDARQMIGEAVTEFFEKYVKRDICPPAEVDDLAVFKRLYPSHVPGPVHQLSANWEIELARKFELAKIATSAEKEIEAINARILEEMKGAEYAQTPGGIVIRARVEPRHYEAKPAHTIYPRVIRKVKGVGG